MRKLLVIFTLFFCISANAQTTTPDPDGLYLDNGVLTYERICNAEGKSQAQIHSAIKVFAVRNNQQEEIFRVDDPDAGNLVYAGQTTASAQFMGTRGLLIYFDVIATVREGKVRIVMQNFTGLDGYNTLGTVSADEIDFNKLYAQSVGHRSVFRKKYVEAIAPQLRSAILYYADDLCKSINQKDDF